MDTTKILLVDDEPDFLELLGTRVKEWGYMVIKTPNGADAVAATRSENPDIIILDYMMPVMDGIKTLKEIRKFDKKVAVIMFTAHPEGKKIAEAEKLGISAFIPKLSVYSDILTSLKSTIAMIEKRLNEKE